MGKDRQCFKTYGKVVSFNFLLAAYLLIRPYGGIFAATAFFYTIVFMFTVGINRQISQISDKYLLNPNRFTDGIDHFFKIGLQALIVSIAVYVVLATIKLFIPRFPDSLVEIVGLIIFGILTFISSTLFASGLNLFLQRVRRKAEIS